MTGNRFAGKVCIYCNGGPSTTDDHIFARKFFLPRRRNNLPQVPACRKCNGDKAALEAELMGVLPFGGRHTDGSENLSTLVPRRLAKNLRLARRLRAGQSRPWTGEGGVTLRGMAVPLDWGRMEALFVFIAKGVAWHEWGVRFDANQSVIAHLMIGAPGRELRKLQRLNAARRVDTNLGAGTFRYLGAQSAHNPCITVWEFILYGGLRSEMSGGEPCNVGVVTGPRAAFERGQAMGRRLAQWRSGTRLLPGS